MLTLGVRCLSGLPKILARPKSASLKLPEARRHTGVRSKKLAQAAVVAPPTAPQEARAAHCLALRTWLLLSPPLLPAS